ncbi:SGNH/GDSL hydrolase family protein [Dyadobacter sp. 676]|uniref:SGNH/GDSL hydrolase family protein n=1 Tax=Dyadobacter sp. 676 TaxID=3088362 RepID=A0AAU8FT20_9BACT
MKKLLTSCACLFCSVSAFALQMALVQKESVCKNILLAQKLPFPVGADSAAPDTISENLFDELNNPPASETSLLSSSDKELRYLAIGGSLTAGLRNGGLYRFAQLTSYPNLIARQMALKDFAQPLFRREEANGSEYFKEVRTSPFPTFQKVAGGSAIIQSETLTFNAYSGRVDNLGLPFAGIFAFGERQDWRHNCDLIPSIPYDFQYRHFFRRYLSESVDSQWDTRVLDYALSQKSDLCTIELGIDDFIIYATTGGYKTSSLPFAAINEEGNPLIHLLVGLKNANSKVILATVPDIIDFPYFHFVTPSMARQHNEGAALYAMISDDLFEKSKGSPQFLVEVKDTDLLLPTQNVEALFSSSECKRGISPQSPLESKDILTEDELSVFDLNNSLNDLIRNLAAKFEYPIVDLHGIYKRILDGQFVTDDGVRIDPSYPNGNFFSDDGLHPTALGQAVIANEWIKVINKHYNTRIPLLTISEFSQFKKH